MFTLVVAQRLGLASDLTLGFSILEGVCVTVVLILLVERYLFSTPALVAGTTAAAPANEIGALAAVADAGSGAQSPIQS